jgi:uncharacterized protein (TIGR02996 family)
MADEGSFLRAILTNPTDDLPRLVYADWLDEQQTDEASRKAEFIRLQHAMRGNPAGDSRKRVQHLAGALPVGWLAAVSHAGVENCEAGGTAISDWRLRRSLETVEFAYECPMEWAAMAPTDDDKVRHCDECRKSVHFCETIAEARHHAWAGECVAVNLGVTRSEGDLEMPMMTAGIAAPTYWERADEEKGEGSS